MTATISDTTDLTALRDAINEVAGGTGVVATLFEGDTSKVLLTDHDGDDIVLGDFNHSTGSATINTQAYNFHGVSAASASTLETLVQGGSDSATVHGEVVLSSNQAFAITGSAQGEFFGASGSTMLLFNLHLKKSEILT